MTAHEDQELFIKAILTCVTDGQKWVLKSPENKIEWQSGTPVDDEIEIEFNRLKTEWTLQEYARKREVEYPSIQECVHAILDDDLDALQAKRASIKTKYPKGE